ALGLTHVWSGPGGNVERFAAALYEWIADRPANRHSNHRCIAECTFGYEACYGAILEIYHTLGKIPGPPPAAAAGGHGRSEQCHRSLPRCEAGRPPSETP